MVSGMSAPHPQLDRPGPPAAMMTPAQPDSPLRTGAAPIAGPERVPSSRSDPADGGHQDADQQHTGQGGVPDATWAVFQELRPQFEGLLPLGVIRDCVDQAVRDLHGSISAEALPEMAPSGSPRSASIPTAEAPEKLRVSRRNLPPAPTVTHRGRHGTRRPRHRSA